jgi:predicted dehydrogenase
MAVKTCLMIGGGGMAGRWVKGWTHTFGDRVKIIGLADVNPEILDTHKSDLGLSSNQLFTSFEEAISSVRADFCGVATPPQFHAPAVIAALEAGMPVICEKPIAGTLDEAKNMVRAAKKTGLPCAIIQNYRYARNKQEVVRIRQEGRLGRLQHLVGRYAPDYRKYGSWGKTWRHDMDFGMLFEGSVHHFDMLRFLSGADPETLMGFGWNPEWSSFKHYSSGLYLMNMQNGTHALYEGNSSAAGITNSWHSEYYRAEFEGGSVEIAGGPTITIHRVGQEKEVYEAPEIRWEGHDHLFDEFLNWLDGGPASETRIENNIISFATVIAAKDTTLDGQPKNIANYVADLNL